MSCNHKSLILRKCLATIVHSLLGSDASTLPGSGSHYCSLTGCSQQEEAQAADEETFHETRCKDKPHTLCKKKKLSLDTVSHELTSVKLRLISYK